jgi:hypothetical protein
MRPYDCVCRSTLWGESNHPPLRVGKNELRQGLELFPFRLSEHLTLTIYVLPLDLDLSVIINSICCFEKDIWNDEIMGVLSLVRNKDFRGPKSLESSFGPKTKSRQKFEIPIMIVISRPRKALLFSRRYVCNRYTFPQPSRTILRYKTDPFYKASVV